MSSIVSAAPTTASPTPRSGRRLAGLLGLVGALALLAAASLVLGAKATSPEEVLSALPQAWEILRGNVDAGSTGEVAGILATMRIPRTVLAIAAGAALGMAGSLVQGLTRNPLADPGTLGINAGAALAVAAGIYLFGITSMQAHLVLAFAGAALAALLVFGLSASGMGSGDTIRLVLAGAALAAVLASGTAAIVYVDPNALDALRFWQAGSVAGRGFDVILPALVPMAVGTLLALALGPTLNVLGLGAEAAQGLGVHVLRANAVGLVATALLAGATTAAAGPIGFVGLVVPHVVRALTGPDYRWVTPYAGLAGACLLLSADVFGRVVMRPGELQAGIVIALVGAPAFVWLVRHREAVRLS